MLFYFEEEQYLQLQYRGILLVAAGIENWSRKLLSEVRNFNFRKIVCLLKASLIKWESTFYE